MEYVNARTYCSLPLMYMYTYTWSIITWLSCLEVGPYRLSVCTVCMPSFHNFLKCPILGGHQVSTQPAHKYIVAHDALAAITCKPFVLWINMKVPAQLCVVTWPSFCVVFTLGCLLRDRKSSPLLCSYLLRIFPS